MSDLTEIWLIIKTSPVYQVGKLVIFSIIALSWAGMISYVSKDSEKRYKTERARLFFTILTLFTYLLGFLVYVLVRPGKTLEEKKYEKYLESLELGELCPACKKPVDETYTFCPFCGEEIYEACPSCGKKIKESWEYCPHCQAEL